MSGHEAGEAAAASTSNSPRLDPALQMAVRRGRVARKDGWIAPPTEHEVEEPYKYAEEGYVSVDRNERVMVQHWQDADEAEEEGWCYGFVRDEPERKGWLPQRVLSYTRELMRSVIEV